MLSIALAICTVANSGRMTKSELAFAVSFTCVLAVLEKIFDLTKRM